MRIRHETLSLIFDTAYLALMTNALLAVGCSPVVAVLLMTDPVRSWPLLAALAPLCAPAVCGAFAVLAGYTADRSTSVITTFARSWRATVRRASIVGAIGAGTLVVLAVDARAAWGHPIGALVIPALAVAMVVVVATSLLALVVLAERPTARLRVIGGVCLVLAVRRWYLTLFSLGVLALFEAVLVSRPAIALGLAAAPLFYVVWANSRFTLAAALGPVSRLAPQA